MPLAVCLLAFTAIVLAAHGHGQEQKPCREGRCDTRAVLLPGEEDSAPLLQLKRQVVNQTRYATYPGQKNDVNSQDYPYVVKVIVVFWLKNCRCQGSIISSKEKQDVDWDPPATGGDLWVLTTGMCFQSVSQLFYLDSLGTAKADLSEGNEVFVRRYVDGEQVLNWKAKEAYVRIPEGETITYQTDTTDKLKREYVKPRGQWPLLLKLSWPYPTEDDETTTTTTTTRIVYGSVNLAWADQMVLSDDNPLRPDVITFRGWKDGTNANQQQLQSWEDRVTAVPDPDICLRVETAPLHFQATTGPCFSRAADSGSPGTRRLHLEYVEGNPEADVMVLLNLGQVCGKVPNHFFDQEIIYSQQVAGITEWICFVCDICNNGCGVSKYAMTASSWSESQESLLVEDARTHRMDQLLLGASQSTQSNRCMDARHSIAFLARSGISLNSLVPTEEN
ncbi:unnamed protein product [Polarella glacialis]|uniref:Uncharacterized protein n=1 Tax=Polarella glacialis TaxID=89957 RepID=A0A813D1L2_POLGL|nr:unnamed protein product [Polarella glacialis]CAE8709564.1 unnamed protein product [Polarella glacialis]